MKLYQIFNTLNSIILCTYVAFCVPLILFCTFCPAHAQQENSYWEDLGLYGGQILSLAIDPDDSSILYAGSWNGDGLFRTTDSGQTWITIPTDNNTWFRNREVFDIDIDPNNPSTIWVSSNMFTDVSYDYGETWNIGFINGVFSKLFCHNVEVDPHDSTGNTIYIGTGPTSDNGYGYFYRSTEGSILFKEMSLEAPYAIIDLGINPQQPGELWGISSSWGVFETNGIVYVSPDNGTTWHSWSEAYGDEGSGSFGWLGSIAVHPSDPSVLFTCGSKGVARKVDGPLKSGSWYWTSLAEPTYTLCIPNSEPDTVFAGLAGKTIAKSVDKGATWDFFETPDDFYKLASDPFNPDTIYAGGIHNGIFKSNDGAETWETINSGIKANAIFSTDFAPDNSSTIVASTVAGVFLKTDTEWKHIEKNSSKAVRFHPQDKNIIYAGFAWKLGKSTDSGTTWQYRYLPDLINTNSINSIAVIEKETGNDIVLAAVGFSSGTKGQIVRIDDDPQKNFSKSTIETVLQADCDINVLAVNQQDSTIIFAGAGNVYSPVKPGGLYASTDGGDTWSQTALHEEVVNALALAPSSPDIIYAACRSNGIYKSTDSGSSWLNKSEGLPEKFTIADISVDKSDSNIVYQGLSMAYRKDLVSFGGVYMSLNGGEYWNKAGLTGHSLHTINANTSAASGSTSARVLHLKKSAPLSLSPIFAGTSSGLFEASSGLIGLIHGYVKTDSGDLLDNATVTCKGSPEYTSDHDGYYEVLASAGEHMLSSDHKYYTQETTPLVVVTPGSVVYKDIIMKPVVGENDDDDNGTSPDNSTCPVKYLVEKTSQNNHLILLRMFRDEILVKSPAGRQLVDLYYDLACGVWNIIKKDPKLSQRCLELISSAALITDTALKNKSVALPQELVNSLMQAFIDLQKSSPPTLKHNLSLVKPYLKKKTIKNIFESADIMTY